MGTSKDKYRKNVDWKEHWSYSKRNKKMKGFNKRKELAKEMNWEDGCAFRLIVYSGNIHKVGFDDDFKLEGYKEGGPVFHGDMGFELWYDIFQSNCVTDHRNKRKRMKEKKRNDEEEDEEEDEEGESDEYQRKKKRTKNKESFRTLRMAFVLPKPIETYSNWNGRVENPAKAVLERLKKSNHRLKGWNIDFTQSTGFHTSCKYLRRGGYDSKAEYYHGSLGYVYTFYDLHLVQDPE